MLNKGEINEQLIFEELDQKRFCDLNDNWKMHIRYMFENVSDDDVLQCTLYQWKLKPDLEICINGVAKQISIKSGDFVSIHEENLNSFIDFLRGQGISERTIKIISFYHYGGSTDGSNECKMTGRELQKNYARFIRQANVELNQDYVLRNFINRAIRYGTDFNNIPVDYVYYGGPTVGVMASVEEIIDIILEKRRMYYSCLHFGAFTYQPATRSDNTERAKVRRHNSQIKWPTISFDIMAAVEKRKLLS